MKLKFWSSFGFAEVLQELLCTADPVSVLLTLSSDGVYLVQLMDQCGSIIN